MIFNSFQFLWLFPLIFAGYHCACHLTRKRHGAQIRTANLILIAVSYGLYMQWRPSAALFLLGVTAVTFAAARLIELQPSARRRLVLTRAAALLTLMPLATVKYGNLIDSAANALLGSVGITTGLPGVNIAIPIGISFFSIQALGYLLDVFHGRIKAEHSWWDYMLFVSFFPQITSGPISKASQLLPQIKCRTAFDYNEAVEGLRCLLWGMFLKVVAADRLGIYVDTIFGDPDSHSGGSCLLATVFYSFQIYCDFAGYSLMAVGTGRLMGFRLPDNFRRPYLSASVTEFWRRWHISLSVWLRDYIYIPLGGNRRGRLRSYSNTFVTFLVSGLWHGANWTFVLWGALHGAFLCTEKALGLQKCAGASPYVRAGRTLATFMAVSALWIIFRMPDMESAAAVMTKIVTGPGDIYWAGRKDMVFSLLAVITVAASDLTAEYCPAGGRLMHHRNGTVRWAAYALTAASILLAGVFDSGQFIYVNF